MFCLLGGHTAILHSPSGALKLMHCLFSFLFPPGVHRGEWSPAHLSIAGHGFLYPSVEVSGEVSGLTWKMLYSV